MNACQVCHHPLSEARAALGLTVCSGPCHAARTVVVTSLDQRPLGAADSTDPLAREAYASSVRLRAEADRHRVLAGLYDALADSGEPVPISINCDERTP